MLTLAECQALAAAYPEVRGHDAEPGDLIYATDRDEAEVYEAGFLGSYWWCPRLDQLLAMAGSVGRPNVLGDDIGLMRDGAVWRFGHAGIRGDGLGIEPEVMVDGAHGDTPEAAVCAWLLAAADTKRAGGWPRPGFALGGTVYQFAALPVIASLAVS